MSPAFDAFHWHRSRHNGNFRGTNMAYAPTSSESSRAFPVSAQVFTYGAIALILVFGVLSILKTIRSNSPLMRVTERLVQSGKFEVLGFPWQSDWSLTALEDAPWAATTPGAIPTSSLDPNDGLLVINLWATWCEPCRTELPDMFKMAREYRGKKVRFLFMGYEDEWEAPAALFRSILGAMPQGVSVARDPKGEAGGDQDPNTFWARLGATALPETFFVRDGIVVGKVVGAISWSHPDIRQYIDLLLGDSSQ
ncbi:MAG: thiol-disulfide isomerase/thioredoxin [Myxococcota bacterium]|jgi:thiol-disulfide isomerase/thioredoxin